MAPKPPAEPEVTPATPTAVAERWALVTARDVMRTDVITVPYATPLSEVERILSDNRISGAPVTDESGHIVGILSLKDIISALRGGSRLAPASRFRLLPPLLGGDARGGLRLVRDPRGVGGHGREHHDR